MTLLVAMLLLAACGSNSPSAGQDASKAAVLQAAKEAKASGYESQYDKLRDGVVTKAEYEDAIDRSRACTRDAGLAVGDVMLSPVDGLRQYYETLPSGQSTDVANRAQTECTISQLTAVELQYLQTHTAVMDGPLRQATVACLQKRGIPVTGNETNVKEFFDSAGREHIGDVGNCISSEGRSLYPNLTSIIVTP